MGSGVVGGRSAMAALGRVWARAGGLRYRRGPGRMGGHSNLNNSQIIPSFPLLTPRCVFLSLPKAFPAAPLRPQPLPAPPEPSGAASRDSHPRPASSLAFPANPWKIPRERVPAQQLEAEEDSRLGEEDQQRRRDRRDPAPHAQGQEIPEPLRDPLESAGNSGSSRPGPAVPVTSEGSRCSRRGFGGA